MKAGEVISFRLPTRSVQQALAALRSRGVLVSGMSLSSAVKVGVLIALDSLEQSGAIAPPDSFNYLNEVTPFKRANPAGKLEVSRALERLLHGTGEPAMAIGHSAGTESTASTDLTAANQAETAPRVLRDAAADVRHSLETYSSWNSYFKNSPYWPEFQAAGVSAQALADCVGPVVWTGDVFEDDVPRAAWAEDADA